MKLLTNELEKLLPGIKTTEAQPDPVVFVKFFDPCGSWTWYATEYDPVRREFFGFVRGFEDELGYFSLDELSSVKNKLGLGIERDLYWQPTPLSKVKSGEVR
ncbi:MAG: DUF2958 domain-containing protein [Elusimicrobiota bacterium]